MTTRIAPGVGANLLGQHAAERNQEATVYVGNLETKASEELLWELFVQAGPVVNVYVPKDRVTNAHQGYGFVEFRGEEDADYAIKVLNMIKLYGKAIRVNKASQDKKSVDVGANLFIGNLDPDVDEKLLYDTFSAFGVIVSNPKIMRDPETGNSRGFGFISYDSFEASDAAIETMNGQYLCNRQITVSYAYKKDTKGERHGTPAERVLAASNPTTQKNRPHTMFASGPQRSLRLTILLRFLCHHDLLQMELFLHLQSRISAHHLHNLNKPPSIKLCRCLHHHLGRVSHQTLVQLAFLHKCSTLPTCHHHLLHNSIKLLLGLHLLLQEWLLRPFGGHHHHHPSSLVLGYILCTRCRCPRPNIHSDICISF